MQGCTGLFGLFICYRQVLLSTWMGNKTNDNQSNGTIHQYYVKITRLWERKVFCLNARIMGSVGFVAIKQSLRWFESRHGSISCDQSWCSYLDFNGTK